MGPVPDITPLFYLAIFGLFCAAVLVLGGGGWLLYHLIAAVALYAGSAP